MRFSAKGNALHDPKKLWHKHHEILRMHISGLSNSDIADMLNVTAPVVSYTLNSTLGQQHLERLQHTMDMDVMDAGDNIRETAKESQAFLHQLISGEVPATVALRAKACMDNLDRAGHSKINKSINLEMEGQLTLEEINEIKRDALGHVNCVAVSSEVVE